MTDRAAPARPLLGYAAAAAVVLIWSTWLVASRAGAQSALTVFDLAAMRYGISAIVALPIVLYYKPWRQMSLARIAALTFVLSPAYILFVFGGFSYAPAAHGGVFMNGALPAITVLVGWLLFAEPARARQLAGVVLIAVGAAMAAADASRLDLSQSWLGDLMFLVAAVFFSFYLLLSRLWQVSTTQVLLCSSLINAVIYVPVWWLLLPSGLAAAAPSQLLVQSVYQGLIPNLLGLLLVAAAVRHVGPATTAAFMAAVPAIATLLSLLLLAEMPGMLGWLSLALLTPGIVMVSLASRRG